jgi:hypothetical protein
MSQSHPAASFGWHKPAVCASPCQKRKQSDIFGKASSSQERKDFGNS